MQTKTRKRLWRTKWFALACAVLGGGLLFLGTSLITVHFLVDWWWFDSLGYGFYFWQRLLYKYAVFAAAAIVFFLIFWLNFRFASRYFRSSAENSRARMQRKLRKLRIESRIIYIPLSIVLAIVLALPLFSHWQKFLFFFFGPQSGIKDPAFGRDISYYLFSLPLYSLMQQRLFISFLVLLVGLGVLYSLEYRNARHAHKSLPRQIILHLGLLTVIVVLIRIWGTSLWLHSLVYTTAHEPLFYGPGYIEKRFITPLTWAQMVFLAATVIAVGIAALMASRKRKIMLITAGIMAGCFLLTVGLRNITYFQKKIEKYIVKPNQLQMEMPFIKMNIEATLNAYGLSNIETRDFTRKTGSDITATPQIQGVLGNVPLWDKTQLTRVYRELEELRTYYNFPLINVGRYSLKGHSQQVFLAARELDYDHLPGPARSWVNQHLSYTHGYGLVIMPASQIGDHPMVWFVHGIPLKSNYDLAVKRPEIYFGTGAFNKYVIAPSRTGEIDYPQANGSVTSHYKGRGGIALSSFFRRLVFAYYLKDKNFLVSQQFVDQSHILLFRNIVERVRKLAPFLLLDRLPYLVMTPERLYWIQDAYTTSQNAPVSQPVNFRGRHINYIRNSVKIVVDAYDGTVDFYVAVPDDPIIRAYSRMYPGLFKDMSKMPHELKAHIRYPKDIFDVQMDIYAKYHQTDPETFYEQEDIWDFARTIRGSKAEILHPYYLSLNLIKPENVEFSLMQPMTPKKQDNLRAIVAVGCDGEDYGRMVVYNFPKGQLIYSPVQIEALINANPEIVRQFNLWNLTGSEIQKGKMIILPADKTIYYIQPIFLVSRTPRFQIPELQRVVMTQGQIAVMDTSLEEAYRRLARSLGHPQDLGPS